MPPQQRQNARFTFQEAFSKHSVAVMSAPGRDPDPTVSRSSCKQGHHTEVLRNAVAKLVRNMGLPDLATRRGLKSCYRNFDSIIDSLLAKATQHDGHVSAAAAIVLCRICRDPCLAEMVQDENFVKALLSFIRPRTHYDSCELLQMAGLELFSLTVAHPTEDFLEQLTVEVIPAILHVLLAQRQDNMLSELCISAIDDFTSSATYDKEMRPSAIVTLGPFAHFSYMVTRQTHAQILFMISDNASRLDPDAQHFSATEKLRTFCMASLRSDSAMDRLVALRAFFKMIPTEPHSKWNSDQVTPLPATDGAVVDMRAAFVVNVTASDAGRFCELTQEFYRVMQGFCVHKDFRLLAHALYTIILEDPLVVTFAPSASVHFLSGKNPSEVGLPYDTWDRTLDLCLSALTDPRNNLDEEVLSVLEIYSHQQRHRFAAAADLARPLASHSSNFWFCYALSTSQDLVDTVRAWTIMQESRDRRSPRDFKLLQETTLYRATLCNIASGAMTSLLHMPLLRSVQAWEICAKLGLAAITASHEHLMLAPYDDRNAELIGDIRALSSILFHGPRLSGASQIPDVLSGARRHAVADISARVWHDLRRSFLRTTARVLSEEYARSIGLPVDRHFPTASKRDDSFMEKAFWRGDVYAGERECSDAQVAVWRAMFRGEWNGRYARSVCWSDAPPELLHEILLLNYPDVKTHSCAICGRKSVVLYRCSACRRMRYCDDDCETIGRRPIGGNAFETICDRKCECMDEN